MKIILSNSELKKEQLIKIALRNKLFSRQLSMQYTLRNKNGNEKLNKISIAYINNIPVGCAISSFGTLDGSMKEQDCDVYVKKSYRRKGIGTKLVDSLNLDFFHCCSYGADGNAYHFWETIKVNKQIW